MTTLETLLQETLNFLSLVARLAGAAAVVALLVMAVKKLLNPKLKGPQSFKIDLPGVKLEFASQEKIEEILIMKPNAVNLLNLMVVTLTRLDKEVREKKANIFKEAEVTAEEIALTLREGLIDQVPYDALPYVDPLLIQTKSQLLNKLKSYVKENRVPYGNEKELESYIGSRANHIMVFLQSPQLAPLIVRPQNDGTFPTSIETVLEAQGIKEEIRAIVIRFFRFFARETQALYEAFARELQTLETESVRILGKEDGVQLLQNLKAFSKLLLD